MGAPYLRNWTYWIYLLCNFGKSEVKGWYIEQSKGIFVIITPVYILRGLWSIALKLRLYPKSCVVLS
jgi:hypothetical protein